jgi:hypothetical protein
MSAFHPLRTLASVSERRADLLSKELGVCVVHAPRHIRDSVRIGTRKRSKHDQRYKVTTLLGRMTNSILLLLFALLTRFAKLVPTATA